MEGGAGMDNGGGWLSVITKILVHIFLNRTICYNMSFIYILDPHIDHINMYYSFISKTYDLFSLISSDPVVRVINKCSFKIAHYIRR